MNTVTSQVHGEKAKDHFEGQMGAPTGNLPPTGFILVNIRPFKEDGLTFAECIEMNLVARGETESEAIVKLLNLVTASLTMANLEGNLAAVIKKAGMKILPSLPEKTPPPPAGVLNWFMPVLADAGSRAVG